VPELTALWASPRVRAAWESIVSLDPLGMSAARPTIAATNAKMTIPELQAGLAADADGKVVDADGQINVIKCAVDPVWNLPGVAALLGHDEGALRGALAAYTGQADVGDAHRRAYLPPVGGTTLYFFGDPSKLADAATEVAVRCHDACCGSDCFGTDICTCRPYLVYAIQACVETAKRGGVGVIAYFRKCVPRRARKEGGGGVGTAAGGRGRVRARSRSWSRPCRQPLRLAAPPPLSAPPRTRAGKGARWAR